MEQLASQDWDLTCLDANVHLKKIIPLGYPIDWLSAELVEYKKKDIGAMNDDLWI